MLSRWPSTLKPKQTSAREAVMTCWVTNTQTLQTHNSSFGYSPLELVMSHKNYSFVLFVYTLIIILLSFRDSAIDHPLEVFPEILKALHILSHLVSLEYFKGTYMCPLHIQCPFSGSMLPSTPHWKAGGPSLFPSLHISLPPPSLLLPKLEWQPL